MAGKEILTKRLNSNPSYLIMTPSYLYIVS
jgi:hypothetical protein